MPNDTLLPCPFCGIIPDLIEIRGLSRDTWKIWHPQKSICPLNNQIIFQHSQEQRAIEYWNLRYKEKS